MMSIRKLNDDNWQDELGDIPALILLTTGNGIRGDFSTAFRKAATEHQDVTFAEVNVADNPQLAETFNVKEKPVLIGLYCGETFVRRVRPWGSDVVLSIELLKDKAREQAQTKDNTTMADETTNTSLDATTIPNDKPVTVTDADFQEQVVDHSQEMPVLVDFWAEWCGPCKTVAPIMEKLAAEYAGKVRVAKVDTDANPGLSQAFRIMSIPTIMAFKGGHLIFNQPGAFPEEAFRDLINQVIELDVEKAIAEAEAQENGDA
jgi:thioredoxin